MELKKSNTILLVIDIINECCHKRGERPKWNIKFKKIRKMVPKLAKFIKEYKKIGGKVIYVKCTPWDKKHLAKNIIEIYKDPTLCYYTKDNTGFAERFYKIKPAKEDLIVEKNTYDAFTNPKLNKFLKKERITNILITGVFGEGCVQTTINGGFSKGYNMTIIEDFIETRDDKKSQLLLSMLKKRFWAGLYGHPKKSGEILKEMRD